MAQLKKPNPKYSSVSNGEAKRYLFERTLQENRKSFSKHALGFLLAAITARQNATAFRFSKTNPEFISSNLLFCFSHLDSRIPELSNMKEEIASRSEEILSCKNGQRMFPWAMERAVGIAEDDSSLHFAHTISLLFRACAKVCSIEKAAEIHMFFSAFDGLPLADSKKLLKGILAAESLPDIYSAISIAHSESQQRKTSTSSGIFSGSKH
ncbi:hypothetical protein GF412_05850 [Candidatus Micrarchaeota archaeon]|nr:hypothetical protein [Candidatus Micrarchaeota archaeon]MBD3418471.1 hypothetical protein [Candidatus Micrarchaeota archaeon]